MKKMRALVFAAVGALVLIFSVGELFSVRGFINRATRADGTVVRLNAGGSHPEVQFRVPGGEPLSYPQNGLVFGFREGDAVTVLYDAAHPRDACIEHAGALWGFPVLFAVLGGVFITAAWFSRK